MTTNIAVNDSIILTATPTLLDPTADKRVLPDVTWAPRILIYLTWSSGKRDAAHLQLVPTPSLAQWLPDSVLNHKGWNLDLALLTDGLDAPAGDDDVMVSPSRRKDLIEIILDSGRDQIGLRFRRAALVEFVARVHEHSVQS